MRRAFFRAFTFAICICEDIVFNTLQYTFAVSNVGLMRVVATPGFSNKIRNYHNLKPIKSFLTDLITPIVKSAVAEAMPEQILSKGKNLVPVQRITEIYGMSQSKIYSMFKNGELNKIKQGGLTFVDTVELENLMKEEKLWAKKPLKIKE